ncbi:MAG: ABC transporter ATP-binding protein [Anaerolineales bacterium]|nr:ABC transporter ATP-binding protein [Anaerolineales bacterium]
MNEKRSSNFDPKQVVNQSQFKGLWTMLSGYHWLYVVAVAAVGFSAVARTAFYYLLRYFTDDVLGSETAVSRLPWVALGFIALALFQGGFTFLSGKWSAEAAEGATRRLRDYLYDHIQHLSFTYHDKTPTGELIQRATSDVDALRRFYADQAIGAGRIILLFLVNFAALLTLNVRLALISIILIPLVLLTSVFFFRKVSQLYEEFQEQEAKLSTTLQENLSGIRVVKAFARQAYEMDKFEGDNFERYTRGKRLLIMHAVYWPSTDILVFAQLILGYFVGATMAINGIITVGTFIAYMGMLNMIAWPLRQLGRLIVDMSTGIVSFGRVLAIIREDREPLDVGQHQPTGPVHGEIVFDRVGFHYDGETAVLHNISFRCQPGQVIALIGSTGAGKTTLVNLLPRFYDYNEGSVTLDGVELRDYPRRYLRQQIGIVQQEPFLFSRTIRENILYGVGRNVSDEEIEAAARAAAIHEVILTFPDGYSTLVGEKGVTLSGGQKQRMTLARTLLKDPRILILDDATSSVDTETETAIREALEQLLPGRTTFIIAHRIQTVMNADLILVMDKGNIIQTGTHDELMAAAGTYQRIFNLQSQIENELEEDLATTAS